MEPTSVTEVFYIQFMGDDSLIIRNLVTPIHNHEGELVRNRMTKKLEEDQATEEVRRAINAWLYEGESEVAAPIHNSAPQPTFGEVVSRIILAYTIGQATLRGYFGAPDAFNRMDGPTRWAIEATYKALWAAESHSQSTTRRT